MLFFYLLAACLFLAGCSREPKAPDAAVTAVTDAVPPKPAGSFNPGAGPTLAPVDANDRRPILVAFGDSLTAGFGVEAGLSYPDYLQKSLGDKMRVVNAGISGETTTGALSRVDTIIALKPKIVIVEFGGNDGLRGLPISTTRANLEKIVTELKAAGPRLVLAGMTLPPNYGPVYIHDFEQIYVQLAAKYKLALIPFLLKDVFTPDMKMIQADGIHPTAAGNRKVAATVLRTIEPLLKF